MNTQMRGSVPEASGEASGPEGDDSNMGTVPTSGPEATSSQGKHTPGPWRLYRRNINHAYVIESNDVLIARMVGINNLVTANARLIAAAPDLLAALQLFIKQWEACGPNSDFGRYFKNVRDTAVYAIAKAIQS